MEKKFEKLKSEFVRAFQEVFPIRVRCSYSNGPLKIVGNHMVEAIIRTDRCLLEYAEGWKGLSDGEISCMDMGSYYCLDFCQPVRVKVGDVLQAGELQRAIENSLTKATESMNMVYDMDANLHYRPSTLFLSRVEGNAFMTSFPSVLVVESNQDTFYSISGGQR